jgi:hypothetical protein
MMEMLNGKYGEDNKVERTSVNQMGKSTIYSASMSEKTLLNLVSFKVGSELMSNHMPLSVVTETQTKACTQVKEGNNDIQGEIKTGWEKNSSGEMIKRLIL